MPDFEKVLIIDETNITCAINRFEKEIIAYITIANTYIPSDVDTGYYCKINSFPIDLRDFKVKEVVYSSYMEYYFSFTIEGQTRNLNAALPALLLPCNEDVSICFSSQNINGEYEEYEEALRVLSQSSSYILPLSNIPYNHREHHFNVSCSLKTLKNYINIYSFANANNNNVQVYLMGLVPWLSEISELPFFDVEFQKIVTYQKIYCTIQK